MADEGANPAGTATETEPPETESAALADEQPGTAIERAEAAPPARAEPQLPMLPGEVRPHPTPQRYVMIAAILVVATAAEVGLYYLEGDVPDGLIIAFLLMFAVIKFVLVASWYMHMKVDQAFFRRVFVVGMVGAGIVYGILLLVFSSTVLKS